MELGCGSGLLGICLQRAGAGHIVLTDGDIATLENCRHNLSVNNIPAEVHAKLKLFALSGCSFMFIPESSTWATCASGLPYLSYVCNAFWSDEPLVGSQRGAT